MGTDGRIQGFRDYGMITGLLHPPGCDDYASFYDEGFFLVGDMRKSVFLIFFGVSRGFGNFNEIFPLVISKEARRVGLRLTRGRRVRSI